MKRGKWSFLPHSAHQVNQQLQAVFNRITGIRNGEGPNENPRKINYLNGDGEGMLEKNKQNPSHEPTLAPIANLEQGQVHPKRAVGGHPANVTRHTGRQEAWEPKICLVDISG